MRILHRTLAIAAASLFLLPAVPASAAYPGTAGAIAFARDGNIHVRAADGTLTQVTQDGRSSWPRWSPDGTRLAYIHAGDLWIAGLLQDGTFDREQITHGAHAGGPAWSPDGNWIAYLDGSRLYRIRAGWQVNESDQAPVLLREVDPSPLAEAKAIAWSPDGRWISFPGGECTGIYDDCLTLLNLESNQEKAVATHSGGGNPFAGFSTTPAFTADGTRLLWTTQSEQPPNGERGPVRIRWTALDGTGGGWLGEPGDALPAPSPAGGDTLAVAPNPNGTHWITVIRAGNTRETLTRGTQPDWQPRPGA
ncbi:TolB family protein [Longispora albida]|uniref:TolB family protein n=1 Tax=Longispora albida TaxID=203523 RepID=UPI000362EBBC|nr:PD40 domain-containing protein [Longispora albida]